MEIFDQSLDSRIYRFSVSGSLVETGSRYIFYVEFSKVVEALNPAGFSSAVESDTEPMLLTEAISVTALDLLIVGEIEPDPVTVVSDLNGNPVVVQVGDEYNWNNSLDGVILWSVEWESEKFQIHTPFISLMVEIREILDFMTVFLIQHPTTNHTWLMRMAISRSLKLLSSITML